MYVVIALLIAFIAPLVLLPIEKVLPYPFIIEELVKLIAVSLTLLRKQDSKWIWAFLIGLLFSISESTFYLSNFLYTDNLSLFPIRILLTGSLHSGTSLLMYFLGRKGFFWLIVGFICAILLHFLFNIVVADF